MCQLNKILLVTGVLSAFASFTLMAQPVYEKVWLGMSVAQFNKLELGSDIDRQTPQKVLTSYGLIQLDSEYKKYYFDLNQTFWNGLKVGVKNNRVQDYLLQGKGAVSKPELQAIFSNLIRLHGIAFEVFDFHSFSKDGFRLVWKKQNQFVALRMVLENNDVCRVSIRESCSNMDERQPLPATSLVALEPWLGKDFHQLNAQFIVGN